MARKTTKNLKAVDLFCGCGGLSLGLSNAGFKVVAAVDIDGLAADTYELNHPDTLIIRRDIRSVSGKELLRTLNLRKGELDLLAGCPPCQGFSTLRTFNGNKLLDEPMNDLVFEFLRFVKELSPKTIMMENVPGLFKDWRLTKFCDELRALGYEFDANVLNAKDYGVPQRRRRMILLASKNGKPSFAPIKQSVPNVSDAIGKLRPPKLGGSDPLHDYPVKRAEKTLALIRKIPKDGGSRTDLPLSDQLECHKNCDGFKDVYGRMAWAKPAPTMTGGCINPSKGRFLHPVEDRAITLREAALIQGFPKRYRFSLAQGLYPTAQMIGNAFPPKFAETHARKLVSALSSQSE